MEVGLVLNNHKVLCFTLILLAALALLRAVHKQFFQGSLSLEYSYIKQFRGEMRILKRFLKKLTL